jgi:hypothetical protein
MVRATGQEQPDERTPSAHDSECAWPIRSVIH